MYELEFKLPGLPHTTNSLGRKHWSVKAREARLWKSLVFAAVYNQKPLAPLTKAKLTLTRYSSGACDADGLVSSFKAVIDGLVTAGILIDDRFANIGMPEYRQMKSPPKGGFIVVRVEEIAA